jgi:hypothetical protein
VLRALEEVNPLTPTVLNIPAEVWEQVEPWHTAIREAVGARAKRSAWRAWRRRVAELRRQALSQH